MELCVELGVQSQISNCCARTWQQEATGPNPSAWGGKAPGSDFSGEEVVAWSLWTQFWDVEARQGWHRGPDLDPFV